MEQEALKKTKETKLRQADLKKKGHTGRQAKERSFWKSLGNGVHLANTCVLVREHIILDTGTDYQCGAGV